MAVILRELFRNYKLWVYEYSDQRTIDWPLMRSPIPMLAITGIYLWFVLKAGPAFMKNRQPFQLDRLIQIYNIVQVVLCARIVWTAVTLLYGPWGHYSLICQPLDLSDNELNREVISKYYLYFLLKIIDLLDTVFFVLRKKQAQVSFLHVYHHATMVIIIWIGMRFLPGGHFVFLGVMNSFVHTIMYAYYFITNYDKEYRKKMWWKKYVTQLQLFQFASLLLHSLLLVFQPNCDYPKSILFATIPQNSFIFLLFWDFYRKAYLTKKTPVESPKVS